MALDTMFPRPSRKKPRTAGFLRGSRDRKFVTGDGEDGVAATAKCGDRRAIEPEVPRITKDGKSTYFA